MCLACANFVNARLGVVFVGPTVLKQFWNSGSCTPHRVLAARVELMFISIGPERILQPASANPTLSSALGHKIMYMLYFI